MRIGWRCWLAVIVGALAGNGIAWGQTTAGCCGQRMAVAGDVHVYTAKGSKAVPRIDEGEATEIYGKAVMASADLPAGIYTVEIGAAENGYAKPRQRLFDIAIGGQVVARGLDLFAAAGGAGKPYVLSVKVNHAGGAMRILFTSLVDNAKFSTIYVLDAQGNKVAWAIAADMEDLAIPEKPPVVSGPEVWKDASASFDVRVADLVKRMTVREKVEQLMYRAPAIARLGIPAYVYWNECLHGVARNGAATVFPQAIGMAASFDPALVHEVGDVISTEARAKYAAAIALGEHGIYQGLNFWTPNINIFRDPRWGRGQETYGEDPFLTGRMAVAFITGLQGDDAKYLKVAATAKHFAVHSGPESMRHVFDARPPERDFFETYLPQFEAAVREGHVASVMASYNSVYGEPASASELLLGKLLRGEWGFTGFVVSDCGAVTDIWAAHQVAANRAEAAAMAVRAGTDLECGNDYTGLLAAIKLGLVKEEEIDTAVSRVMKARFRLGLFDPPGMVPFASITPTENDTPAHDALALKMAEESIVLLKNDGVLPLKKGLKKIAIVGPNAEGLLSLLGNYNGTPTRVVMLPEGIRALAGKGTVVDVVRGCDTGVREGGWQVVPDICLRANGETGLRGEYFANERLEGKPAFVRQEKVIDFNGSVEWIIPHVPVASGSMRWTGEFVAPADGDYQLVMAAPPEGAAQGHRLWVNGKIVDDRWEGERGEPLGVVLPMKAGEAVPVKLECHQKGGFLGLELLWRPLGADTDALVAERVKDADVIVFASGYDGRVEAEEGDTRAEYAGFADGDREVIELPAPQRSLLKALAATKVPVVLVNMTGSAVAIPEEAAEVGAVVQAWYPGQAGGKAMAEALFGEVNPSGRLPVTFYRATADLPAFTEYAMESAPGRTYRYFTGKAEWPFGFGMSYTTFTFGHARVDTAAAHTGETVHVSVDVTNSGARDGETVAQVYAVSGGRPRKLVGFQRCAVRAGERATVNIPMRVEDLRQWNSTTHAYEIPAGDYELRIAESADDVRAVCTLTIK